MFDTFLHRSSVVIITFVASGDGFIRKSAACIFPVWIQIHEKQESNTSNNVCFIHGQCSFVLSEYLSKSNYY